MKKETGTFFYVMKAICLVSLLVFECGWTAYAAPWWSQSKIEEKRQIEPGIVYERIYFVKTTSEPVRAHILSVTGLGSEYIFGVLGSFGTLFPPSVLAKQSGAVVVVNGGYFSSHPSRGLGLVAAHNRILYLPYAGKNLRGAVGFSSNNVLFDWIGLDDLRGHRFHSSKPGWNQCHAALGAGPLLIKAGYSRVNSDLEGFNTTLQAPRTAIGKTAAGEILLMVVDGRQPGWSTGVTLAQLAEIMLEKKAADALNLDGGGSSVLVVHQKILNRPSDFALPGLAGKERAVANVIALFRND